MPSETNRAALDAVRVFCAAWGKGDVDRIVAMLAPDVEWENVPIGIIRGREAARVRIANAFEGVSRIEWRLRAIAVAEDGLVLTERVDVITGPRGDVTLPIMGVFRVGADGISLWRDYFDAGPYLSQLAEAAA